MAHYIAYATEAGTTLPQKMKEQVLAMLTAGVWGVPASAQLKAKLLPGDRLIIAVGAPYREFVGDAVLGSRYRRFSDDEFAALPPGLEFDHGLTLSRARIWAKPISIAKIWIHVAAAQSNPEALFLGAINTIKSPDAAVIVAAGTGNTSSGSEMQRLLAPTQLAAEAADAEDARIIALMNARRAEQAKPPLSPAQEEQVRQSRRSEREKKQTW